MTSEAYISPTNGLKKSFENLYIIWKKIELYPKRISALEI